MPEGHTLHRLARRHRKHLAGQVVSVSSPQGRFADQARELSGARFSGAEAWGKHLIHRYADGAIVHVHLGLYGAFTEFTPPVPTPVGQVRMRVVGNDFGTDLRGPTACEIYTEEDLDSLVARLGPDPLRRDAEPELAWQRISKSAKPFGALLMDQRVVAGVGNVYRAEVLFRAGIDPFTPGNRLGGEQWQQVWSDLVTLMPVGVRSGRMHVVRPDDDHGAPSYASDRPRTYVYRRAGEHCRVCGTEVAMSELDNRKVYWCPTCQHS